VCLHSFGVVESLIGPAKDVYKLFNITTDAVIAKATKMIVRAM
jgi:hypothetical protein